MTVHERMTALIALSAAEGVLRKLVLSLPTENASAPRQSGKLCRMRGGRALVMESAFEGGRVSQTLYKPDRINEEIGALLSTYREVNLLTSAGDAVLKTSKKGTVTLLGADKLEAALRADGGELVRYDLPIDRTVKHILTGGEPFLRVLGIADAKGRVHDKRQGKFRQINRFLEYLADVYPKFPANGELLIYDLCCGKSYLSFAVYHYLTALCGRRVRLIGIDRKGDVMADCSSFATRLGFTGMEFRTGDVRTCPTPERAPDLVMSLHACDIATDIVLSRAVNLGAQIILSTPCCHRQLSRYMNCAPLSFVTRHPQLTGKLCDSLTDGLRLLALEAAGYEVMATELTDPENTPKNTLLRAIRRPGFSKNSREAEEKRTRYRAALDFLLGDRADDYLASL